MSARRVLFFAEAVSLAHVARPVRLAESLDNSWDIHFALANEYRNFLKQARLDHTYRRQRATNSIPTPTATWRTNFSTEELERSVTADLRLIESTKPDVVVGDFRLSLAVSARLAKVPYVAICNAHWSPWSKLTDFPSPDISILNAFGPRLANLLFRIGRPAAFWLHTLPINRIRRQFGLQPYRDIRFAYTDGDLSLYADTPYLVRRRPCLILTATWVPSFGLRKELTGMVEQADGFRSFGIRYAWLDGTSRFVADGVAGLREPWTDNDRGDCWTRRRDRPRNASCRGFSTRRSSCGASRRSGLQWRQRYRHQALSKGTPVVGICSNLDQFLTMHYVSRAGAGVGLRAKLGRSECDQGGDCPRHFGIERKRGKTGSRRFRAFSDRESISTRTATMHRSRSTCSLN